MSAPDNAMRLLFDHIPKAGGTSFHVLLEQIYGRGNVSPRLAGVRIQELAQRYRRYRAVCGHLLVLPGDRLPSDTLNVTLLRNPVDRVVSEFFYRKHDAGPTGESNLDLIKSADFSSLVTNSDQCLLPVPNAMVRHYSQYEITGNGSHADGELLECAKRALERFDVVGTLEQMPDFLDLIAYELRWTSLPDLPWANATSSRPCVGDLAPEVRSMLFDRERYDLELHAFATELMNHRRRAAFRRCIFTRQGMADRAAEATPRSDHSQALEQPNAHRLLSDQAKLEFGDRRVAILEVIVSGQVSPGPIVMTGEEITIRIRFVAHERASDLTVGIQVLDEWGTVRFGTNTRHLGHVLDAHPGGEYFVEFRMLNNLGAGSYLVGVALHPGSSHLARCYHWQQPVARIDVVGNIGCYFDGQTKLHPVTTYGGATSNGHLGVSDLAESGEWGFRHIAVRNPPLSEFRGRVSLCANPGPPAPGQVMAIAIEVENLGGERWRAAGLRSVAVSYHWYGVDQELLVLEGERSQLPVDVAPGQKVRLWATVIVPPELPQAAVLRLTLVQEWVAWFDQMGDAYLDVKTSSMMAHEAPAEGPEQPGLEQRAS